MKQKTNFISFFVFFSSSCNSWLYRKFDQSAFEFSNQIGQKVLRAALSVAHRQIKKRFILIRRFERVIVSIVTTYIATLDCLAIHKSCAIEQLNHLFRLLHHHGV